MSGWHRADIFRCALAAAAQPRALDQVEGLTIGLVRFQNKLGHLVVGEKFARDTIGTLPFDMANGRRWIAWPYKSAIAERFSGAASHCVSKRPIWLGEAAQP